MSHRSTKQNQSTSGIELSQEEISFRDGYLKCLSNCSEEIVKKLFTLAQSNKSNRDRQNVASVFSKLNLPQTGDSITKACKAISYYRTEHPKEKRKIKDLGKKEAKTNSYRAQHSNKIFDEKYYETLFRKYAQKVPALREFKKIYFGLSGVERTSSCDIPVELKAPADNIKALGLNFYAVLDNFLIASSLNKLHAPEIIANLLLPKSSLDQRQDLISNLLKIETVVENSLDQVGELLVESAEFVASLYKRKDSGILGFFTRQKYPYAIGQSKVLALYLGLEIASSLASISDSCNLTIVPNSPWEGLVLATIAKQQGKDNIDFNENFLDLPVNEQRYSTIHVNGSRIFVDISKIHRLTRLVEKLTSNGRLIFSYNATPVNRLKVVNQSNVIFLKAMVTAPLNLIFDYKLAKTNLMPISGEEVPHLLVPFGEGEQDVLTFVRKNNANNSEQLSKVLLYCGTMANFSCFQDLNLWNGIKLKVQEYDQDQSTFFEKLGKLPKL